MFKHLANDASEGNRLVVCCERLVTLFKNEGACLSKLILMIGVISSRSSLSRKGSSLSGAATLSGFRFVSSFGKC